jgi:hypothetical protein
MTLEMLEMGCYLLRKTASSLKGLLSPVLDQFERFVKRFPPKRDVALSRDLERFHSQRVNVDPPFTGSAPRIAWIASLGSIVLWAIKPKKLLTCGITKVLSL